MLWFSYKLLVHLTAPRVQDCRNIKLYRHNFYLTVSEYMRDEEEQKVSVLKIYDNPVLLWAGMVVQGGKGYSLFCRPASLSGRDGQVAQVKFNWPHV